VTCGSTSGPSRSHQPDAVVPAAIPHLRLVRRSMRNIRESLAKMAGGMTPVIDTEVPLADVRARLWRGSKAGRCSARSSSTSDASDAAHHALFPTPSRPPNAVRPHHPLHRTEAARASDRPRQSDGCVPGKIARGNRDHSRAASGTISGAWAPNSPISIISGSTTFGRALKTRPGSRSRSENPSSCFAQLRARRQAGADFRQPTSATGNYRRPGRRRAMELDAAILYRRPNIASADRMASRKSRAVKMGDADVTCVPTSTTRPVGIWK
jgi:hypothetical protein